MRKSLAICLVIFTLLFLSISSSSAQTVCKTLQKSELASLVKSYFPSGITNSGENIWVVAYAVACAESGRDTCAEGDIGDGKSIGIWQINIKWHPQYDKNLLTNPTYNIKAACQISSYGKNWQPWYRYKDGAYKKYIPDAKRNL